MKGTNDVLSIFSTRRTWAGFYLYKISLRYLSLSILLEILSRNASNIVKNKLFNKETDRSVADAVDQCLPSLLDVGSAILFGLNISTFEIVHQRLSSVHPYTLKSKLPLLMLM